MLFSTSPTLGVLSDLPEAGLGVMRSLDSACASVERRLSALVPCAVGTGALPIGVFDPPAVDPSAGRAGVSPRMDCSGLWAPMVERLPLGVTSLLSAILQDVSPPRPSVEVVAVVLALPRRTRCPMTLVENHRPMDLIRCPIPDLVVGTLYV